MAKSLDVALPALPDHVELSELVHDAKAFIGQCKHPFAAGILFEDHIPYHQPVPDNGGIRLDEQGQHLQLDGFGLKPPDGLVQRKFQGIELGLVVGAVPEHHPAALENFLAVQFDLEGAVFLSGIAEAAAIKIDFHPSGGFGRWGCGPRFDTEQAHGLIFAFAFVSSHIHGWNGRESRMMHPRAKAA